ncbi:hypothetical protein OPV22_016872 [Ensete ventricosum]|uniref:Uncharacterized protein n=1 Tax=Ensete ventricosum TaxID=4639 RepID=A0AAV8QWQ7_ENSVE|nr:hypothetical protein OPV22_016872 [Ensete ventricosum]
MSHSSETFPKLQAFQLQRSPNILNFAKALGLAGARYAILPQCRLLYTQRFVGASPELHFPKALIFSIFLRACKSFRFLIEF